MLLSKLLPPPVQVEIMNIDRYKLNEIRFRVNQPVSVTLNGKKKFLGYVPSNNDIADLVMRAAQNSLYAHESEILKGYINVGGGIRVGVCGEAVCDGEKVNTVKNIQAVNIRVPREVRGASAKVFELERGLESILVIAPCGGGKTTFLRDMAQRVGEKYNVTVIDERGELCAVEKGIPLFDMKGCDIITSHPRKYAFENALRSMSPDVTVTDEIFFDDLPYLTNIVESGVKVFASAHGVSCEQVIERFGKESLKRIFDLYVVLGCGACVGEIMGIYNADFVGIKK